jgi:hypothetical protein
MMAEMIGASQPHQNAHIDTEAYPPQHPAMPALGWEAWLWFGNTFQQHQVLFAYQWASSLQPSSMELAQGA